MTIERQCPACRGTNFTRPGPMQGSGKVSLHRQFRLDDGSWLGGLLNVYAEGVLCLDCGYIMLFARSEDLQKLRASAHQIKS